VLLCSPRCVLSLLSAGSPADTAFARQHAMPLFRCCKLPFSLYRDFQVRELIHVSVRRHVVSRPLVRARKPRFSGSRRFQSIRLPPKPPHQTRSCHHDRILAALAFPESHSRAPAPGQTSQLDIMRGKCARSRRTPAPPSQFSVGKRAEAGEVESGIEPPSLSYKYFRTSGLIHRAPGAIRPMIAGFGGAP